MPYKHSFGPFAPEVYRAPLSYPYRDDKLMDGELAARRAIDVIDKQVGPANLAAVIIEPIQGEGGFIVPADGFLPALAEWCRANDVVFIADEIQTGFARTGAMFASGVVRGRAGSDRHGEGNCGWIAARRRHRPNRDHGCAARRRSRWDVRRKSRRLRRGSCGDGDDSGSTISWRACRGDRADHAHPTAPHAGRGQPHRGCPRPRAQ